MKILTLIFGFFILLSCENKNPNNISFEKIELSDKEILKEISDSTLHNAIGKDELITDEETAISIVEPLLFKIYGEENILKQRPYKIGKVQNYWVISGSLPKPQIGGVFIIIINSKDGRIEKYSHGK